MWLIASLAFKYYVVNITDYAATYGAIGGVMVLMLWFYISGVVILIGAEMNAEIEHASPYGKEPGEKVPGQKRIIGPAAMRAWLANRRSRGRKPPSADDVQDAKFKMQNSNTA
jgi:membrane protein